MYEDALEYANKALEINPKHSKAKFRKGKALSFLFNFQESIEIFETLGFKNEVENVKILEL